MPHVEKKKKVVHSEYSGCFRGLTNDPAIIKMQTDAFGLLIHHTVLLHTAAATVALNEAKAEAGRIGSHFQDRGGFKWLVKTSSSASQEKHGRKRAAFSLFFMTVDLVR